ncbi:acetyltransferase [Herbivorax sp. ANBcel31]|uniref:acetyltransferase n=1 Tax=Herbivorax sp. ANBcel31 TaxID=3069754 RepID=UPI0027B798D3|nr:acetyltransferase [Herbivorax sp. ANBcel31]MDQ2086742.1 acetyltransferase [Herbivorax sp. ANBcel31]
MFKYENLVPENYTKEKKMLTEKPTIAKTTCIKKSYLGRWTEIGDFSSIVESEIGDFTYLAGHNNVIYSNVGKFCSIASHVRINPGNHPMWRVTQHHMTYRRLQYGLDNNDDEEFFDWRRSKKVEIGHDVWLGHGVVIMPGVKVGIGSVIGSGAVVTKDIPDYSIAVGVPAKVIKKRFDDFTIKKIIDSKWWEWEKETIENKFKELIDLDLFLKNN